MGALKRVPALGKDLLEDTPVPRGLWHHRGAPSWGDELLTVQRLYHASSASSTPHRPVLGQPSLASFILESRGLPGSGKCKILCYGQIGQTATSAPAVPPGGRDAQEALFAHLGKGLDVS